MGLGQCRVSGGIGALAVFIFLLMKGIHNIFAANPLQKAIHPCAELSTQHKMLGFSQEFEVTQTGPFLCSWEHHLCREQIMDAEKLKQHTVLFRCQSLKILIQCYGTKCLLAGGHISGVTKIWTDPLTVRWLLRSCLTSPFSP